MLARPSFLFAFNRVQLFRRKTCDYFKLMCGITFIHSENLSRVDLEKIVDISHRGPDASKTVISEKTFSRFDRLAIMDLNSSGMQPFESSDKNIVLMCNGEIFNWERLVYNYDLKMQSSCDCEVILRLFEKFIDTEIDAVAATRRLCDELDGEFAFILYMSTEDMVICARDPFGVRPLFEGYLKGRDGVAYASELKAIQNICNTVEQFKPGYFMIDDTYFQYHQIKKIHLRDEEEMLKAINSSFREAVTKRLMSDRNVGCLLSGGLDSSLVAGILAEKFGPGALQTFAIGMAGSPDLEKAKIVADHIKSNHTSIELTETDFLESIEEVVATIESYDTTTVRASVGNFLVAKYIKNHTNCKVIFNGDYSDEICGGYKYLENCKSEAEFDNECDRLLSDIHLFDSLRSDRCVSRHGLEGRVPFADKEFVDVYKSIPTIKRMSCFDNMEKYMLRKAFENDDVIPADILWRRKEAFSDGVSKADNSWHNILKNYIDTKFDDSDFEKVKNGCKNTPIPTLKETAFYKSLYEKHFIFDCNVPYFWLPKFSGDIQDPSAREIASLGA